MAIQTLRTYSRPRKSRSTRFYLDVTEWVVLQAALADAVPQASLPADFAPSAFGLDGAVALSEAERCRAWQLLTERGLARYIPSTNDLDAVVQPFAAGLMTLGLAEVRVDLRSWSGNVGTTQSTAWRDGHTFALSRQRGITRRQGARAVREDREGAVEISFSSDASLVEDLMQALPMAGAPAPIERSEPVTIKWEGADAVADAMRRGCHEVVPQLLGLPREALSALGQVKAMTGGVQILAYESRCSGERSRPDVLAFEGVWAWTASDVVELTGATQEEITLQRTSIRALRTRLLSALTRLLHADEVL